MPSSDDSDRREIMTLSEVADYLRLAERTVLRMAQRGEVPAAKVASQWRFLRPLIQGWVAAQMRGLPEGTANGIAISSGGLLQEVIHPELTVFDIAPGPKEAILQRLVGSLIAAAAVRDPTRLLTSLMQRERVMTTGIGHGVAIPHPRRPIPGMFPEPVVVVGMCPRGTDYQAIDDQLVHVVFLVCATRIEVHLDLMAKVAWLMRQPEMDELKRATSSGEVSVLVARAVQRIRKP